MRPPTLPAPARVATGPAALCGVLAVAAALAAGDLVAALVSPPSSPFLAVGAQVIRLTPEWLKEFAIATFGTHDKLALLIGMGVVLAAVAAGAGLAGRRDPTPAVIVIGVLGVVAAVCTVAAPTFAPFDLFAPAVADVVGMVAFTRLHRRAARPAHAFAPGGDPGPARASRRRFLLAAGATAAGALVAGAAGRLLAGPEGTVLAAPTGPPPIEPPGADFAADGTPRWLTPTADFYRIDTALQVPRIATPDYALRVHGLVDRELELTYDDLRSRRLIEAPITMTCVSNEIGGDLISTAVFRGVPLADLLADAGIRLGAEQVAATSADGFTTGTPIAALVDGRTAMLALEMNGAPLPVEHGFPVRMVVPGLYGYVSGCKWLTDLELTTFGGFQSYWEQRGWATQGPVKTQSRIDVPQSGALVAAGRVTVAGVAWAQHTGIDRVEVRADAGPWMEAELARDVSIDTWRMWRARLELPPGRHQLQVRATDRTGTTQTPRVTPTIPDGASGWHTIRMTAR